MKSRWILQMEQLPFPCRKKSSLLQVILKEKEQASEEAEEPKQEVSQTEEWELPDEAEYQQRLKLAKALGVEDWLDEEGWPDDLLCRKE